MIIRADRARPEWHFAGRSGHFLVDALRLSTLRILRLFSLPSISESGERRHLELGVEGDPVLVDQAMDAIRTEVERRNIVWRWRT